jgi:hypothetical protein
MEEVNEVSSDKENVVKITRREEILRQKEARMLEELSHLTFKPTIRRGRDETVNPTNGNGNSFDRLYNSAKQKKDLDKKKIVEYSFKPEISELAKSRSRAASPDDRTNRLFNSSGSGRHKEPASKGDKKENFSFKPEISKRAKSLERRRDTSPATRLYEQAEMAKKKIEKLKEDITSKDAAACTFTPRTNSARRNSTEPEVREDITERMQKYIEQRTKNIELRKQQLELNEAEETTFRPTFQTKHRRSRSNDREQKGKDVFDRLSTSKRTASPGPESESDKEYTFHPTLIAKPLTTNHVRYYILYK